MKLISTIFSVLFALSLIGTSSFALAKEYNLPPEDSRLIGEMTTYVVPNDGRSLEAIAAHYEVGLIALMSANPGVDPLLPKAGSELIIPSMLLLPDLPRNGIIINLSELRLYYYPKDSGTVVVYPIGIGQLGRDTPLMTTRITEKRANPTWTPTANIRRDYASRGIILPAVVPAGPENPMGRFALRLAAEGGTYLIHGTNADFGIGMRVSSGCIRLRPDNIEHLFDIVPVGTQVVVIDEAFKFSLEPDGKRYVEVHQPLSRKEEDDPQTLEIKLTPKSHEFIRDMETDTELTNAEITHRYGYPVDVTRNF